MPGNVLNAYCVGTSSPQQLCELDTIMVIIINIPVLQPGNTDIEWGEATGRILHGSQTAEAGFVPREPVSRNRIMPTTLYRI